MGNIRDEIEKKLEKTGTLSSNDVAEFYAGDTGEAAADTDSSLSETSSVSTAGSDDVLVKAGGGLENLVASNTREITVTANEKAAYIAAIIANTRFVLDMGRFGGAYRVKIRSRTTRETDAILRQLQRESRDGKFAAQMDQVLRLRAFVMTFQVAAIGDVDYESPEEPLVKTVTDKGESIPAWVSRADKWYDSGDAENAVLWSCIQEFEDKYWVMTDNAASTNFWGPVVSS